jgi:DNA-binding response OmpR family regulator
MARATALRVGNLRVHPNDAIVSVGGEPVALSRRELQLLTALARRAHQVVSRNELSRKVWGRPLVEGDRSVDVYIRKLRVKLAHAAPGWSFIETHVTFGYRLAPRKLTETQARLPRR